jgi:uncharacterized protein YndB with AHSA1/START domain
MRISTSTVIDAPAEAVWPLLTDSQMTAPGRFCMGVPRPVACELPENRGRVGAERRCISDRGTVVQRITEWQPPRELKFEMMSTDHSWGPCVESIQEHFTLVEDGSRTRITRHTTLRAKGTLRRVKEALFCIGLKRVHLYVFRNWRLLAAG